MGICSNENLLIIPYQSPSFKPLIFEISCCQDSILNFLKGHISGSTNLLDKNKNMGRYFFMRNLYVKFQNLSMHGL